jgi:hypothetical protein
MNELEQKIRQTQEELKRLNAQRNMERYEALLPMEKKYFKSTVYHDMFFFVDFISKDTFHPFGWEVYYKEIGTRSMSDPGNWTEISKEEYSKAFDKTIELIKKDNLIK